MFATTRRINSVSRFVVVNEYRQGRRNGWGKKARKRREREREEGQPSVFACACGWVDANRATFNRWTRLRNNESDPPQKPATRSLSPSLFSYFFYFDRESGPINVYARRTTSRNGPATRYSLCRSSLSRSLSIFPTRT